MTLKSDRSHHSRLQSSGGRRNNKGGMLDAKGSVVQLQEYGKLCQSEVQEYKQFASDFDKVIKYNAFTDSKLDKEQFCKILIDLAMV